MSETLSKPWYVYLVRAANNALYCGISDDVQRRFAAHQGGRGARFFHALVGQIDIPPSGETVGEVPFRLTMAEDKDRWIAAHGAASKIVSVPPSSR